MRSRLLLLALSIVLAVMSIGPATAAPTADGHARADDCEKVLTAGTPVLLDALSGLLPGGGNALPIGLEACSGVRPGALVQSDQGMCTFNYVFSGSDGRTYIGTAGHCILGLVDDEQTWAPGSGPEARDATGERIGEFAYAVFGGVQDFALVRIDEGVATDPQMCHFGGPTGVNDDLGTGPVVLQHYGQGVLFGQTVPGRTAVALSMSNPDHVIANGVAAFGDSGAAINSSDGRAVGVVVTVGLHLAGIPDAGLMGVTRLTPQRQQAEDALGIALELQTAPQL